MSNYYGFTSPSKPGALICEDCVTQLHDENDFLTKMGHPEGGELDYDMQDLTPTNKKSEASHCKRCGECLNHDLENCIGDGTWDDEAQAGDQSDNAAAAQALSQTIQAPQDRAGDINRRPGF